MRSVGMILPSRWGSVVINPPLGVQDACPRAQDFNARFFGHLGAGSYRHAAARARWPSALITVRRRRAPRPLRAPAARQRDEATHAAARAPWPSALITVRRRRAPRPPRAPAARQRDEATHAAARARWPSGLITGAAGLRRRRRTAVSVVPSLAEAQSSRPRTPALVVCAGGEAPRQHGAC
jgi:hypothetical protein